MKTFIALIAILLSGAIIISSCKKKDDNNEDPANVVANYDVQSTITLDENDYSFDVTGTTHFVQNGSQFTTKSDFTMGTSIINNVVVDGTIVNNQVSFTNKEFIIHIYAPALTDSIHEKVIFSTGPVGFGGNTINGSGTITLQVLPDGIPEHGTFTYSLTKKD